MIVVPQPPATELYEFKGENPDQPLRVESLDDPPPGKLILDEQGNELIPIPAAEPAKTLNYQHPGAIQQKLIDDLARSRFRDYYLPSALIIISIVALWLFAVVTLAGPIVNGPAFVLKLGLRIVWDLAVTLLAGMMIYGLIDSGIGEWRTATLKLVAMGLFRFALSAIIAGDGSIGLVITGFVATFPIVLYLFHYFFEFDLNQSMLCTLLLSFVRLISYFGLWKLM